MVFQTGVTTDYTAGSKCQAEMKMKLVFNNNGQKTFGSVETVTFTVTFLTLCRGITVISLDGAEMILTHFLYHFLSVVPWAATSFTEPREFPLFYLLLTN